MAHILPSRWRLLLTSFKSGPKVKNSPSTHKAGMILVVVRMKSMSCVDACGGLSNHRECQASTGKAAREEGSQGGRGRSEVLAMHVLFCFYWKMYFSRWRSRPHHSAYSASSLNGYCPLSSPIRLCDTAICPHALGYPPASPSSSCLAYRILTLSLSSPLHIIRTDRTLICVKTPSKPCSLWCHAHALLLLPSLPPFFFLHSLPYFPSYSIRTINLHASSLTPHHRTIVI